MRYLIAADTGGTFTDLAVHDTQNGQTHFGKTLTNYGDLVAGVLEGLRDTSAELSEARLLKHGTTHVINALIQRSGARVALVTTDGFRDVVEMARGNRPIPFEIGFRRNPPLVDRSLCFEVPERIDHSGAVLLPLDEPALETVAEAIRAANVEAVAVSFINAYRNSDHEDRAEAILARLLPGVFVTSGTRLSREWSEFERATTAVANAYVGTNMDRYISDFVARLREQRFDGPLYMMGSNGGIMSTAQARRQPIALLESGPIGGCIGAGAYATALGLDRLIAFDMGGTTAKCALVEDGSFDVQSTYYVGGYERGFPVRTPVLDIVEVGAGGGSIAWIDAQGRLRVGPRSAGSDPGPIAFRRGGVEPTVTDANVALGRIGPDSFMNGRLPLDLDGARAAIRDHLATPLGFEGEGGTDRVAQGVLDLAVVTMTGAIKEITIERGRDVRDYALFVFGGGGPIFGSELARELGIGLVVVPPQPGAFSSLGMLMAEARLDLARTILTRLSAAGIEEVRAGFEALTAEASDNAAAEFGVAGATFEYEADMRYRGQKHTVRVRLEQPFTTASARRAFEAGYKARYGRLNDGGEIDFVVLRVGALVPIPRPDLSDLVPEVEATAAPVPRWRQVHFEAAGGRLATPIYRRAELPVGFAAEGPAVIEEYSATTIVGPHDRVEVGRLGELRITCPGASRR
ncbi:hydantoinase/oxoprolinase family protein [Xanthobacter flavus]|uniref:hydantoinase/oxoprolinase family protein n=1 Tax=Xanthobacter flavus TaxID=281 RepID=UPI00372AB322